MFLFVIFYISFSLLFAFLLLIMVESQIESSSQSTIRLSTGVYGFFLMSWSNYLIPGLGMTISAGEYGAAAEGLHFYSNIKSIENVTGKQIPSLYKEGYIDFNLIRETKYDLNRAGYLIEDYQYCIEESCYRDKDGFYYCTCNKYETRYRVKICVIPLISNETIVAWYAEKCKKDPATSLTIPELIKYYGEAFPGYGIEANPDDMESYRKAVNNVKNLNTFEINLPILRHKDSSIKRDEYKSDRDDNLKTYYGFRTASIIISILSFILVTIGLLKEFYCKNPRNNRGSYEQTNVETNHF